jgi:hypothetical protein
MPDDDKICYDALAEHVGHAIGCEKCGDLVSLECYTCTVPLLSFPEPAPSRFKERKTRPVEVFVLLDSFHWYTMVVLIPVDTPEGLIEHEAHAAAIARLSRAGTQGVAHVGVYHVPDLGDLEDSEDEDGEPGDQRHAEPGDQRHAE